MKQLFYNNIMVLKEEVIDFIPFFLVLMHVEGFLSVSVHFRTDNHYHLVAII